MEVVHDQASSLRASRGFDRLDLPSHSLAGACASRHDARLSTAPLVAIASGKGGVGKTFLAVNLALALRAMGYRPLLVDLDWGLANVDVALGLAPTRHLGHVAVGECSLEEAMIGHEGITVVPNGCGQSELAVLDADRRTALLREIEGAPATDVVLLDTHPGISPLTVEAAREAGAVLVVSTPEPTALTDTYALIKVLGEGPTEGPAGLVINQAGSPTQAYHAARHLDSVSRRFLGRSISCWGSVLQDAAVPRSVREQRALLTGAPRSEAARRVRQLAATVAALVGLGGCRDAETPRVPECRVEAGAGRAR